MIHITASQVHEHLNYPVLIQALQKGFCEDYVIPQRHHHDYVNPKEALDSTLLLMPAWQAGAYLGVKLVTVSPNNGQYDLPAIQGTYLLYDAHRGTPLAQIEAKALTSRRTAATSALAASFLARLDSHRLLIVGTGALAPQLIEAYASIRPIEQVMIWGRRAEKAEQIRQQFEHRFRSVEVVQTIEEGMAEADIISCATLSSTPLVKGAALRAGQHLDLIGSYKPDMREADDEAIRRSDIFIDTENALRESGDLYIPLQQGWLKKEAIQADLFQLCQQEHRGRTDARSITLFKSVGYALEDLVAAKMVYEKILLTIGNRGQK